MRSYLVAAFAVIAAIAAVSPASAADDKPGPDGPITVTEPVPGGFRSWDELLETQEKLNAAAEVIESARQDDSKDDDGYSGLISAPENRKLQLYWKDPIPPKMREAIAKAGGLAPVTVTEARHSERELLSQGDPILASAGVSGVSANPDGSGLTVSVTGSVEEGRKIPAVRDAKVPVTIDPFVAAEATFNRQDDIAPYWGGAKYTTPGGGCSTGFAVNQGGTVRMLTAGHCGSNGQTAKDGGGQVMGTIALKNPPLPIFNPYPNSVPDVMIINTSSAPRVYTGGTSSNASLPVKSKASSAVGNYVCTSGSYTGTHCPIKVEATNLAVNVGGIGKVYPLVKASHITGKVAVGKGDSGGPVFSWKPFGGPATARGTITAGSGSLGACGLSSGCFTTVYYADITRTTFRYVLSGNPISVALAP